MQHKPLEWPIILYLIFYKLMKKKTFMSENILETKILIIDEVVKLTPR